MTQHARGQATGPQPAQQPVESRARAALRAEPELDLMFAAHSHDPALVAIGPRRYYVNSGDEIEHMTYVALPHGGAPDTRRWGEADRAPAQNPVRVCARSPNVSGALA